MLHEELFVLNVTFSRIHLFSGGQRHLQTCVQWPQQQEMLLCREQSQARHDEYWLAY
eukprot:m.10672 g.10672  ORF g.10672 m.10672 type:complete len:57 (-) comp4303_c0_seq1:92-262(-)